MTQRGEKIGQGGEKIVYNDGENPEQVIAVYKDKTDKTALQIKGGYYFQKIIHLLFPENFPDIRSASFGDEAILVSEKIETDEEHRVTAEIHDKIWDGLGAMIKPEDEKRRLERNRQVYRDPRHKNLAKALSDAGIHIDMSPVNITCDQKGNMINVDINLPWNVYGWDVYPMFNSEKLRQAINRIDGPDAQKRATRYLDRLEELYEEEKARAQINAQNF